MRVPFFLCCIFAALAGPAWGQAAFDAFSEVRAPTRFYIDAADGLRLVIKGNVQLGLHDLEGEGGVGRDSLTDTATIGTRSAFARVDDVRLALRLETPAEVAFYTELAFDAGSARADGAWLDYRPTWGPVDLHVEAGLHTPFVAIDDHTARAPLAARMYWNTPEVHVTATASGRAAWLRWWAGASAALMRPLGGVAVNDAASRGGTISVIGYDAARPFSGVAPVYGGKVAVGVPHATLTGFGFIGDLAATAEGSDALRTQIGGYSSLAGFEADPKARDTTFWWAGGRLDAEWAGVEARLEWVASAESLLRRTVGLVQLGYSAFFIEPRVRYERYRLGDASVLRAASPSEALTWDWDVWTVAVAARLYRDVVRVNAEYSVLAEDEGDPDAQFANNEFTLQLELRF